MNEPRMIKMLQCEKCKTTFGDDHDSCPNCGCEDLTGFEVANPVSRLPMERVLNVCGHFIWLIGVTVSLTMLWQCDSPNQSEDFMWVIGGFLFLFSSIIGSVTLFALGEMLKRTIRIQRRVRAFMEEYKANMEDESGGS